MSSPPRTLRLYQDTNPMARRTIDLIAEADGSITLSGGDIGQLVADHFGDSDWEFWTKIPAVAVQRLALALLFEKLNGQAEAWEELKSFCTTNHILHSSGDWH